MTPIRPSVRVSRPRAASSRAFRVLVPVALGVLTGVAVMIALLAAAVLMGWIPYPGK